MNVAFHRLGDLCSLVRGTSPTLKTPPGDYPLVVTAEFRRSADSWQLEGPAVCVPLISSTGHGDAALHRVHYQEGKFALANLLVALLPKDRATVDARYLYRYLLAKKDALFVPLMLGTANVSLKERDIADVVIPLPPLAEQQRIVGRIEEVASQLQSAGRLRSLSIEETEHVFALTRDRLFASISSRRAPIRDCFRLINGRAFRPEDWSESGMKIVRIQNLKYPDAPFNHFQGSVDERHLVRSGDVLFAWSGQVVSLGAHIWAGEDAILNQHIFNVRFGADLSAPFVRHGWNALVDEMKAQVRGLEMFHIRKQELEQMLFPIPTRAEQAAMVEYLDALQREVDALKQLQERSHAELDALLPAILDRAFAGAL